MTSLNAIAATDLITTDDISKPGGPLVHVLRLDKIHPVVSGNKWFKLKYHLQHALEDNHHTILSFGGAYSNHIVATAFAARSVGMDSIGIIRGEEPAEWSNTLKEARSYGMHLHFISREEYTRKKDPAFIKELRARFGKTYLIPEGGYSTEGMMGAAEILSLTDKSKYTHIVCSVGTGTMMAGLIKASLPSQQLIGISSMKGNHSLEQEIKELLADEHDRPFTLLHDHHFGGYARYNETLIGFMNDLYRQTKIPTDFVYSGKLFFALNDLLEKDRFAADSRILLIHCGGLQGNRSLPAGTLIF